MVVEALRTARHYIDYFLPREVMGPVLIVFSAEHIVEILFERYLSHVPELHGWSVVLLVSIIAIGIWGETDEDMDEFEDRLEEMDD